MGKNIKFKTLLDQVKCMDAFLVIEDLRLHMSEINFSGCEQFVFSHEASLQARALIRDVKNSAMAGDGIKFQEVMRNFRMPFNRIYVEVIGVDGSPVGVLAENENHSVRAAVISVNQDGSPSVFPVDVRLPIDMQSGGLDYQLGSKLIMWGFASLLFQPLSKKYGLEKAQYAADQTCYEPVEDEEKRNIFYGRITKTVINALVGSISILNAKNGTTRTVVPAILPPPGAGKRARKNKSRSRFTVISLTDYETVDSNGNITQRKLVDAHKVRGHFKRTKSGLSWWSPHVRGHGELQEREAYIVNA